MKKLVDKYGKLITASFFIMGIGLLTFFLVIPLYGLFKIDTDIIGLLILDIGVVLFIVGIILRKKMRGLKLTAFAILAFILSLPVLFTVISTVFWAVTGKPLGE